MAAIRCAAGRALLRRATSSPASSLLRRADQGGVLLLQQQPRAIHSLLDRPDPPAASAMGSGRFFSSSTSSSSQEKTATGKGLAIELMKDHQDIEGSANQEIRRMDDLLDLLKVDNSAETDDQGMMKQVIDEARGVVEKKKQELALLLLKDEVEGGGQYREEVREKTEELAAAARRLREYLRPEAERHDLEVLKRNFASLDNRYGTLAVWFWCFLTLGMPFYHILGRL